MKLREGEKEEYRNLKSNVTVGMFLLIFWRQAKLLIWIPTCTIYFFSLLFILHKIRD